VQCLNYNFLSNSTATL